VIPETGEKEKGPPSDLDPQRRSHQSKRKGRQKGAERGRGETENRQWKKAGNSQEQKRGKGGSTKNTH